MKKTDRGGGGWSSVTTLPEASVCVCVCEWERQSERWRRERVCSTTAGCRMEVAAINSSCCLLGFFVVVSFFPATVLRAS